jgi:folylpolyglutamate synthase/dihydropteroate synthase
VCAAEVELPGRLERRGDEIWDGAHTPEAVRYIADRIPQVGAIVASIAGDKDAEGVLRELGRLAPVFVATASTNPRALPAGALADLGRAYFARVETESDPHAAVSRAHGLGSPVLVTGSLYLLADLSRREEESARCRTLVSG